MNVILADCSTPQMSCYCSEEAQCFEYFLVAMSLFFHGFPTAVYDRVEVVED